MHKQKCKSLVPSGAFEGESQIGSQFPFDCKSSPHGLLEWFSGKPAEQKVFFLG